MQGGSGCDEGVVTVESTGNALKDAVAVHAFVSSFLRPDVTAAPAFDQSAAVPNGMLTFEALQALCRCVASDNVAEADATHTLQELKTFLLSTSPKAVVYDKGSSGVRKPKSSESEECHHPVASLRWMISVADLVFAITNVSSANASLKDRRVQSAFSSSTTANASSSAEASSDGSPLWVHFHNLLPQFQRFKDDPADEAKFWAAISTPLPMTLRVHTSEPALYSLAKQALVVSPTSKPSLITSVESSFPWSPLFSLGSALEPVSWLQCAASKYEELRREGSAHYRCEAFQCTHEHYHSATVTPVSGPSVYVERVRGENAAAVSSADGSISVEHVCRTLHSAGVVSFQEVVSMLPVLALGIRAHHRVLDMCAAPGSKTLLAADMALDGVSSRGSLLSSSSPATLLSDFAKLGVIVANEKDRAKATQTLPARVKRHHAPNMIVTRGDATAFPLLITTASTNQSDVVGTPFSRLSFDRVICDVPCSGDGTVRKEASIRGTWSEKYVDSLVPIQIGVLKRAVDSLSDGGIVAYSTCSLNPKEDEELVYNVVKNYAPGTVEVLDVREMLAAQIGISREEVFPKGGTGIQVVDPAGSTTDPKYYGHRDVNIQALSAEIAEKSLRVFPQDYNTGGFFVSLLRKVKWPENQPLPVITSHKLNNWMGKKRFKPLVEVGGGRRAWEEIAEFYGVSPAWDVPSASSGIGYLSATVLGGLVPVAFLDVKGEGPLKRIQLMTPAAAETLMEAQLFKGSGVEVVMAGIRAFEVFDGKYLSDAKCRWRVVAEAVSILGDYHHQRADRKEATPSGRGRSTLVGSCKRAIVFDWPSSLGDATVIGARSFSSHPQQALWELLKNGFIHVDNLTTTANTAHANNSSSSANLLDMLVEAGLAELEVDEYRMKSGGILLGIYLPPSETKTTAIPPSNVMVLPPQEGRKLMWLAATLSPRKIELSVDVSMRQLGLLSLFGVDGSGVVVKQQGKDATKDVASAQEMIVVDKCSTAEES